MPVDPGRPGFPSTGKSSPQPETVPAQGTLECGQMRPRAGSRSRPKALLARDTKHSAVWKGESKAQRTRWGEYVVIRNWPASVHPTWRKFSSIARCRARISAKSPAQDARLDAIRGGSGKIGWEDNNQRRSGDRLKGQSKRPIGGWGFPEDANSRPITRESMMISVMAPATGLAGFTRPRRCHHSPFPAETSH
jgi:hypothetical protein